MRFRSVHLLIAACTAALFACANAPALHATPAAADRVALAEQDQLTAAERAMLERITAQSMRGHVSFLASDLLEGRDTPSRGLEIAAEYIAAQFRRAGLEPIGDDDYFQTATMSVDDPSPDDFAARVHVGGHVLDVPMRAVTLQFAADDVEVRNAVARRVAFTADAAITPAGDDHGQPWVAITSMPNPQTLSREQMRDFFTTYNTFMNAVNDAGAAAVLSIDPATERGLGMTQRRGMGRGDWPAVFQIHGAEIAQRLGIGMDDGGERHVDTIGDPMRIDLMYRQPSQADVPVRNVIGMLRGSDPVLADEYIILSAHYDHIGIGAPVNGDNIYNGANDNASGTTCVMEIAAALANSDVQPARSIIFLALWGEERGLLGARYYAANPIVPLRDTIANINLEHMGRTDDSEGESIRRLMPTGFDFSTAVEPFVAAGELVGVDVVHHPRNSSTFFSRSDNAAFAAAGIPAHTFCAAFIFPDYHGAGDHWYLIDYDNMQAVARAVALGLVKLADAPERPRWNEDHRSTGRYIRAWRELHDVAEVTSP